MAKRLAEIGKACVACGNCVPACPIGANSILNGLTAVVDADRCAGCGKCERACPAGIIEMIQREGKAV